MTSAKAANKEKIIKELLDIPQDIKTIMNIVIKKTGITDSLSAVLFYIYGKSKFAFDSVNKRWYTINKYNIWEADTDYVKVSNYISRISSVVENYYNLFEEKEKDIKRLKLYSSNYKIAIKYLQTQSKVQGIQEKAKYLFKIDKLYENMDNINLSLFAFNNGVYDLKNHKFRLPLPEEYISTTCGYEYSDSISKEVKEAKKDLTSIIASMFANIEDMKYLLSTIAQCLDGNNVSNNQKFYVWKGVGRNGKGMIRDFIQRTFGCYYDPMPMEYLNKTKSGEHATAADEVIARKKNSRIVISTEPEGSIEIKTNKLKAWSGNDEIQCRHMYGSMFNYRPKFKLFIQSNFDIKLEGADSQAIQSRTEILKFPFSFVEKSKMTLDYHKIADNTISQRSAKNSYKLAFFLILVEHYKLYVSSGFKIPKTRNVIENTDILLSISDQFTPFFNQFIIHTKNPNDKFSSSKLLEYFLKFTNYEAKMNNIHFKASLESKGVEIRKSNGTMKCVGIRFDQKKYDEAMNRNNDDKLDFIDDLENNINNEIDEPIKEVNDNNTKFNYKKDLEELSKLDEEMKEKFEKVYKETCELLANEEQIDEKVNKKAISNLADNIVGYYIDFDN